MKKNFVKILVFLLNVGLVWGGVSFIKSREDIKKKEKTEKKRAELEELAKFNVDKTQEILELVKKEKEDYILANTDEVVVSKEETVKRTVPAVTEVVVEEKKVPSTSSSTS